MSERVCITGQCLLLCLFVLFRFSHFGCWFIIKGWNSGTRVAEARGAWEGPGAPTPPAAALPRVPMPGAPEALRASSSAEDSLRRPSGEPGLAVRGPAPR